MNEDKSTETNCTCSGQDSLPIESSVDNQQTNILAEKCCCSSQEGPLDQAMPLVNWPAVFSVLCGSVGLTLITILQPYAVALGIIGLFQARKTDKGMIPAVIGLALGLTGVVMTLIDFVAKRIG